MHRRTLLLMTILATSLGLAACGSSATPAASAGASVAASPSAAASSGAGASGGSATIADFSFSPTSLTVKAGSTVSWNNTGAVTHTVTADDGSFDSGNVASGTTFQHTFTSAGTFAYHCKIHPTMKATVVVTP